METQEHEKPEKRDVISSSSITYHTRQSSTKTEAVLRYVDLPCVNQFIQLVTPSPNPGLEKLEKKDVMTDTNPESGYDDGKTVDNEVHKQPKKGDVMVDCNPKHHNDKTAEKQRHEKPEKRDMTVNFVKKTVDNQVHKQPEKKDRMIDIYPEGKDDEEEVVKKTTDSNRRRA
jgi:hypothetical protein